MIYDDEEFSMTAPGQLSDRPAARNPEAELAGVRPAPASPLPAPPAPASPLPAPPAPVLPIAPVVRGCVAPPACQRVRSPAVGEPEAVATRAPRLNKVVRLAAAATMALAVVGGLGWIGQTPGPAVPSQTVLVRVGAGETVWDVAQRVAPKSDQRAVVERIRQLNGMAGSAIQPGQQLQVPDGRR